MAKRSLPALVILLVMPLLVVLGFGVAVSTVLRWLTLPLIVLLLIGHVVAFIGARRRGQILPVSQHYLTLGLVALLSRNLLDAVLPWPLDMTPIVIALVALTISLREASRETARRGGARAM